MAILRKAFCSFFFCFLVCVFSRMYVFVFVCVCMCGGQRTVLGVSLWLPPCFRNIPLLYTAVYAKLAGPNFRASPISAHILSKGTLGFQMWAALSCFIWEPEIQTQVLTLVLYTQNQIPSPGQLFFVSLLSRPWDPQGQSLCLINL